MAIRSAEIQREYAAEYGPGMIPNDGERCKGRDRRCEGGKRTDDTGRVLGVIADISGLPAGSLITAVANDESITRMRYRHLGCDGASQQKLQRQELAGQQANQSPHTCMSPPPHRMDSPQP